MNKLVIYSDSDLKRDPRVSRQIASLSKLYQVIPVGINPPYDKFPGSIDLIKYQRLKIRGKSLSETLRKLLVMGSLYDLAEAIIVGSLRRLHVANALLIRVQRIFSEREIIKRIASLEFDLILGNDLTALRICSLAKKGRAFVYDAHEYSPGQLSNDPENRDRIHDARYLLRKYLPFVDSMMTVCDGISGKYAEEFRIPRPMVLTNAPDYVAQDPVFREDGKIKFVHHGHAVRRRMLEEMIETIRLLDLRFELHFYLINSDDGYFRELVCRAKSVGRVFFHDPVPMNELSGELNKYDIGFYILRPVNYNQLHALPNKLFEFVQARLGIAIGPSPEMAAYVNKYELGIVSEEFTSESMAIALSGLTAEGIRNMKNNSHKYAYELSSAPQMEMLAEIIKSAMPSNLKPARSPINADRVSH
jgi:hypothetical protein